jgi:hypothetical protein
MTQPVPEDVAAAWRQLAVEVAVRAILDRLYPANRNANRNTATEGESK